MGPASWSPLFCRLPQSDSAMNPEVGPVNFPDTESPPWTINEGSSPSLRLDLAPLVGPGNGVRHIASDPSVRRHFVLSRRGRHCYRWVSVGR